jgi:hypothetical protein
MQWWWPVVNHAHEYSAWVIPHGWQTQVVEAVGDELHISKADGLTLGKIDVEQVDVIGNDGGFRWNEPSEHPEESMLQIPLPDTPSMFSALTNNRVVRIVCFLFWGDLVNNLAHSDLS